MTDKLSFYDLVGFLIPGGIVLGLFYWFCVGFIGLPLSLDAVGLGESILLIGLSYIVGHVVQALGNKIESEEHAKWGGLPSAQLIRDEDRHFSADFKKQFKNAAEKTFGLTYEVDGADMTAVEARRREMFGLCYTLLIQEEAGKHTEIFNGIYSLYRGTLVALRLGIAVSAFVLLKEAILGVLQWTGVFVGSIQTWSFDWVQLTFAVLGVIVSWAAQNFLRARFERFGRHFADSVYRSFYVWFRRHKSEVQRQP